MGFFDFLWGRGKKDESADASAGVAPVVFGDNDSDSSDSGGGADTGASSGDGGGGDGGGV